ncbi:solute carrier family 35 member F5-like [Physella acuta]|uniref:solute carrier family 35 member F5-like n=1 Tax=Physella acuta TaxID=109671 RepID=UPI0027DCBFF4|nr:solute carrier family 35 member F5-like [Physella acuta]
MLGLSRLNKTNRLLLGIIALLIVDIVWVVSGEVTKYIFKDSHYSKPFFTTYIKTVMFSLYLFGFIIWKPWREQCCLKKMPIASEDTTPIASPAEPDTMLGSPIYVPLKYDNYDSHTSGGESDDASSGGNCKSVRFSNLSEVRQLSETYAVEHNLARLSYQASIQAAEKLSLLQNRLPLAQVAKLASLFCFLWFFANYTYQIAIQESDVGVANVMSSTSGLFVLVCAAVFPSGAMDKFTLSKFVAVILSISGVVMVFESDVRLDGRFPSGALWALISAVLYSLYLVMIRRNVDTEDKMDIPMFLGFVGIICTLVMWPGFLILHYSKQEPFEWPSRRQWIYFLLNGAIGTVFAEFVWLLGCFLTSSLIGTLSIGLVIPLNILVDAIIKDIHLNVLFYLGLIPIIFAFVVVSFLTHWENWDPVMLGVKKALQFLCRRRTIVRVRDLDREQTASLITEESHH